MWKKSLSVIFFFSFQHLHTVNSLGNASTLAVLSPCLSGRVFLVKQVYSKHMNRIRETSLGLRLAVKTSFDVATSLHCEHKRRHLWEEKCGLTFPTYHMKYQVSFVYSMQWLGLWKQLGKITVDSAFISSTKRLHLISFIPCVTLIFALPITPCNLQRVV